MGSHQDDESEAVPALGAADEELDAWLTMLRADTAPPASELGAHGLREVSGERTRQRPRGPDLHAVEDLAVPGDQPLAARLYRPDADPHPLVVVLHGGGFVFGGLDSHDRMCRRMARSAVVSVLAVDYRLAPEHPWPAAVDDAVRAVRWAMEDPGRLGSTGLPPALAGDSAGGALVLLTATRLVAEGGPVPSGLVLANPHTDLTLSMPSVEGKGHGWGLDAPDVRWFADQWVPEGVPHDDARISPLHAPIPEGMPSTVLVTAEHDPLRDEGEAFADRLEEAGVWCRRRCEEGLVHGFLTLDVESPACREAGDRLFADVRQLLG